VLKYNNINDKMLFAACTALTPRSANMELLFPAVVAVVVLGTIGAAIILGAFK